MKLFDSSFAALEKALDVRFKRHAVLAGNAANSETPGYRAREVDFAGELKAAFEQQEQTVARTNPAHMDIGGANRSFITYDPSGAVGSDGNNVDLELMMGKLSENGRAYNEAVNFLSIKFRLLRLAARDRGGA